MQYWIMKSEPSVFSWQDLMRKKREPWDGVRNFQARANLQAMKLGDQAFFYHSVEQKCIVGIMEIVRCYYPDPSDSSGKFGMVDVVPLKPMVTPIPLSDIKCNPALAALALVRQGRLSVSAVTSGQWRILCRMGGVSGDL